jgi:hypothetical protein
MPADNGILPWQVGLRMEYATGMAYNPLSRTWALTGSTEVNYIALLRRMPGDEARPGAGRAAGPQARGNGEARRLATSDTAAGASAVASS